MKQTLITSDVLNRTQAAEYLKICKNTLDKLPIPVVQIRRRKVYRKTDLNLYLESQTRQVKDEK